MDESIGRVALVTGASQGLGAAIAARLGRDGVAVVAAARREAETEQVAARIRASGGRAVAVRCDVRVVADVEAAVDRALAEWGRLDVLVSNAGVTRDASVHRMTDDDWRTVVDTHLTGGFFAARAAQRPMVRQGWGRIVFIGSTASAGWRGQVNYSAAKAGLEGMARTLAIELGRFGVTANVVAPGHIDSDLTRGTAERLGIDYEEIRRDRIAQNAVKRVGDPEDVAAAVAYLVCEQAGYVTGQTLQVSGKPQVV